MTPASPSSDGLVGRDSELELLEEAVRKAADGTLHVVFIEGEGGIGKSTLLERALSAARGSGFGVFLGQAEELEQGRPFRSISEAMGCLEGQGDARRAEILSLLATHSGDQDQLFRLIDAFDDLVEFESLSRPVVIAIDDLQWADSATVRALGSLSRRLTALPVLIIGCLRPLPRHPDLATLLRSTTPISQTISLEPLKAEAVRDLARRRIGATPGPRLTSRLDQAAGSPFYVTELVDFLLSASHIHVTDGVGEIDDEVSLGGSVVTAILGRLSELHLDQIELLRAAAILGSGFQIEELAAVAGLSESVVTQAVADLRAHGALEDAGGRLRFRHDLIREAIYEDLGEPVRRTMHRRAAQALMKLGLPASAVAPHLIRSALPGDHDAAEVLIDAANSPGTDRRTACALLEAAIDINPEHPRRVRIVSYLAILLQWQGRSEEATSRLLPLIATTPDGPGRLGLMLRMAGACMAAQRATEAHSWVQRASALANDLSDSSDPTELLGAAEALFNNGEPVRGLALSERAIDLAQGLGGAIEAEANNQCSWMSMLLLRSTAALRFSQQALSLRAAPASSLYWRHHAFALADVDRIPEAEAALAHAADIAETNGLVDVLHGLVVEEASLKFQTGRWDVALVDAQTAEDIAFDLREGRPDYANPIVAWIRYRREEDQTAPDAPVESLPNLLRLTAAFDADDLDTAAQLAREVLQAMRATLPLDRRTRSFESLPLLVRILLASGDAEAAQLAGETAAELADGSDVPSILLADLRCRALLERDSDAARRLIELARTSPRRVVAAEALEDAAEVLSGPEVAEILTEARDFYESIGATRDQGRVNSRLADLNAAPPTESKSPPSREGWDALTAAETEVVRLAAEGLTNREIGAELFISHRTVASHLSNVFSKVGLRSRVDLAREAPQHLAQRTDRP